MAFNLPNALAGKPNLTTDLLKGHGAVKVLGDAVAQSNNASISLKSCSVGGLGEATGTPEADKYAEVLEMEARHRRCVARAEACEADADAWHKQAMLDAEMEAKLAALQDPNFLVSTPMAAMDEADALMRQCTDELVGKIPSLETLDDLYNEETMRKFTAQAASTDSVIWAEVSPPIL